MAQANYQIDPVHTSAHFSVRHLMISNVRGEFTKVSGKILWDAEDPSSLSIEADIDAASINTREPQRDAHLKSPDFLDVEKYPTIHFESTQVHSDKGDLKVGGNLTIHGVTRDVVLELEGPTPETKDPWGNVKVGASATTKINRKDFGLTWNAALETGGVMVGDEIKISIDVEAARQ